MVPYETWTEIKKAPDGNWVGTTNHWYSDPEMMDKVEPEHRLTKFEAGKSYRPMFISKYMMMAIFLMEIRRILLSVVRI